MYVSDVLNGTWLKGIDARATQALAGHASSSEDVVLKPPRHWKPSRGKQLAQAEPVKKKKKPNTMPPRKSGGISIREPLAHRQVIVDWSDDDEDASETLQQRATWMIAPTLTTKASNQLAQGAAD